MSKRVRFEKIISESAKENIKSKLCAVCSKPKAEWDRYHQGRKYLTCSTSCTSEFYATHVTYNDWSEFRERALERDNYTCVKCHKRPVKKIHYNNLEERDYIQIAYKHILRFVDETDSKGYAIIINTRKLIGDHIRPIGKDGEEFDLSNVQTLCDKCNKIKTKTDLHQIYYHKIVKRKLERKKQRDLRTFLQNRKV